jgi:hypothetical protein
MITFNAFFYGFSFSKKTNYMVFDQNGEYLHKKETTFGNFSQNQTNYMKYFGLRVFGDNLVLTNDIGLEIAKLS